jgi:hypothetical protein
VTLLQALPALALWSVVAIRLAGLRLGWKPGILLTAALGAIAVTVNIDPIYLSLDRLLGGENILSLVIHLLFGAGMTEFSRLHLRATGRPARSLRWLLVAGAAMALVQTLLFMGADTTGTATDFTDVFARHPAIALYQAGFFAWIGLLLACTGIECLRRDTDGESRAFGVGFNFVSMGCLVGVGCTALKMIPVWNALEGVPPDFAVLVGYRFLMAVSVLCMAVGFLVPSWDRARSAIAMRRMCRESLDALRPTVVRLSSVPEGRWCMAASGASPDACHSPRQLYRWLVFLGDIRVMGPDLLSPEETALMDSVGSRLDGLAAPDRQLRR